MKAHIDKLRTRAHAKFARLQTAIESIDSYPYGSHHYKTVILKSKLLKETKTMLEKFDSSFTALAAELEAIFDHPEAPEIFLPKCDPKMLALSTVEKSFISNIEQMAINAGIPLQPDYLSKDTDFVLQSKHTQEFIVLIVFKFITEINKTYDEFAKVIVNRALGEIRPVVEPKESHEYHDTKNAYTYTPTALTDIEVQAIRMQLDDIRAKLDEHLYGLVALTYTNDEDLQAQFKKVANGVFKDLHTVNLVNIIFKFSIFNFDFIHFILPDFKWNQNGLAIELCN